MTLIYSDTHAQLFERSCFEPPVACDLLCVDAPYSAKTHAGHDEGVSRTEEAASSRRKRPSGGYDTFSRADRRSINYAAWTADTVRAFVDLWEPVTRGWFVSLTDDVLFPVWRDALARRGRQTFPDVTALIRGMTVRLCGDGPSSWTIHCVVARPRNVSFARWGTLDGGYHGPSEKIDVIGGKPLWLMSALIRDYSRHGDVVIDPCAGGGTTLVAAKAQGRHCIGYDIDRGHLEIAAERLAKTNEQRSLPFAEGA